MSEPGFADQLCTELLKVLGTADHQLETVLARLNAIALRPLGESAWTAENLSRALRQDLALPVASQYHYATLVQGRGAHPARATKQEPRRTTEERARRLLRFGLRNQWYCVAASSEVKDRPTGMVRLGEQLVLWRDSTGRVHAMEDRCPHRGLALSVGAVAGDTIRCIYHGVEVDQHGVVRKVPGLPDCPLEGRKLLHHYPTVEHYGAIWAYFGIEDGEPPDLKLPYELTDADWSAELHFDVWPGNYHYIYDNLLDPMHGIVLHGQTYTQSRGPHTDRVQVRENDGGFEVFREGQRGVNLDWMEFVESDAAYYVRVEIPLPPSAGPGGPMHISFYVTPVDDNKTRITVFRSRRVVGWEKDLWHFLYHRKLKAIFDGVLAQDLIVANALPPWPPQENLYQHDIGLIQMRRKLERLAQMQAGDLGLGDY